MVGTRRLRQKRAASSLARATYWMKPCSRAEPGAPPRRRASPRPTARGGRSSAETSRSGARKFAGQWPAHSASCWWCLLQMPRGTRAAPRCRVLEAGGQGQRAVEVEVHQLDVAQEDQSSVGRPGPPPGAPPRTSPHMKRDCILMTQYQHCMVLSALGRQAGLEGLLVEAPRRSACRTSARGRAAAARSAG